MNTIYHHHIEQTATGGIDFGTFFFSPGKVGEADPDFKQFYKPAVDRAKAIWSKRESLRSDRRLSEIGVLDKLKSVYADLHANAARDRSALEKTITTLKNTQLEVAARRLPTLDKTDAVGAMAERELRDFWRGLSSDEKASLMTRLSEGDHPDLTVALLRASPVLTGLLPKRREILLNTLASPDDVLMLQAMAERLSRLEACQHAIAAGLAAMRVHAGLTPSQAREITGEIGPSEQWINQRQEQADARSNAADQAMAITS